MNKQEFLAMSLPYGLKVYVRYNHKPDHSELEKMIGIVDDRIITDIYEEDIEPLFISEYGLCLRPLSDLTKEIEHNGEKFIPALELIKLEEKYNNWKDIAPTIPYDIKIINKPFGKVLKVSKVEHWVIYLSLNEIERAKHYIVSQLIKWKFDIANLIPKGEAIDLNTLDVNPYK